MNEAGALVTIHGADRWNPDFTIVDMSRCQDENFAIMSEDTVVVAQLIQLRHYTEGPAYRGTGNRQPTNASGPSPNKVQRINYKGKGANYDRIFTFIDLNTPGQCFNIYSQSARKSEFLLKYGKEMSSVGDLFGIVEPDDIGKGSQNIITLTTAKPLIPLQFRYRIIPNIPLVQPERGRQRYFILKNRIVGIHKVTVVNSSCQGLLCDRQSEPSQTIGCGCLHMGRACSLVLKHHVHFVYEDESGKEVSHIVNHYRSWRTSCLILAPIAPAADMQPFMNQESERAIRAATRIICDIVNGNGHVLSICCLLVTLEKLLVNRMPSSE